MASEVKLTEKEEEALRIYTGERERMMYLLYSSPSECPVSIPSFKFFPNVGEEVNVYQMIDTMFYEGLFIERINGLDKKLYCPTSLHNNINEILEMIKTLYSVMYKYGKTIKEEKIVYRTGEQEITTRMKEEGTTILPVSTSKEKFLEVFYGEKPANIEICINPNTPCVDMKGVLGNKYSRPEEQEILIAPFCPIEIEEDKTKQEGDIKYYKATVSSPEKPKEFTKQEQIQNKYYRKLVNNVELLRIAKKIRDTIIKEEIRNEQDCIAKVGNNDYKKFKKWKEALVNVVKYSCREVALELESKYTASDVKSLSGKEPSVYTFATINNIFAWVSLSKKQRRGNEESVKKSERDE